VIARMSSAELSGWLALFAVHAEEDEHRRDLEESGDGVVIVSGHNPDRDDDGGDWHGGDD